MTSKRANEVNRAIAEACGWTDIHEEDWFIEDYGVYDPMTGLIGVPPNQKYKAVLPDYTADMNAAMGAAGELLPGKWHVGMHPDYSDGFVFFWQYGAREEDNIESIHATLDTVPAAICEAIVTARGLVVESEVSYGKQ